MTLVALSSLKMFKKENTKLADNLSMVPMPPKIVAAQAKAPLLSAEASNALLALGYNEKEAATAMKVLPADIGTSDGIRQALKLLSKV